MESLIDVCLYLIIFGAAFLIVYGLVCAIIKLAKQIIRMDDSERRMAQNRAEYRAGWRRANGHDTN